ncbi:unnamed protein product [Darwinula stevensoni]|uniref:Oplophorus-luciferin 2-monooxygenase non-catalytic subunit n=1 Tax=Darwinula stevensoni TaxID=69355 RepID=A0A7R8WYE2_9CRUS|nr:unnamed protein product [Darwinula stevensoni]CAG0879268.1 unnamed protein product [Darwinula stevensoni]
MQPSSSFSRSKDPIPGILANSPETKKEMVNRVMTMMVTMAITWTGGLRVAVQGQQVCPDAAEIRPCNCTFDQENYEIDVDCSDASNGQEIHSAFNCPNWFFKLLREVRVSNSRLDEIVEDGFAELAFKVIHMSGTRMIQFHETALNPSKDRLEVLTLKIGNLDTFPWHALSGMTKLKHIDLSSNSLREVPSDIPTPFLESLFLTENRIDTIHGNAFRLMENLKYLRLGNNFFQELPTGLVNNLTDLVEFFAHGGSLECLAEGTLNFNSPYLEQVRLESNRIASIQPGAISGLEASCTLLDLSNNNIRHLAEGTFLPIVRNLTKGNGELRLYGNPVECDCTIAWLVLSETLLRTVTGTCTDGVSFQDLDPEIYLILCTGRRNAWGDIRRWKAALKSGVPISHILNHTFN